MGLDAIPSYTKTYHKKSYPAISPDRSELNHSGKTVIITGAGSGIGEATAISYARAGATHVVLIGRRSRLLEETNNSIIALKLLNPPKISTLAIDINDELAVAAAFSSLAPIDVLVNCAAYLSDKGTIRDTSISNFWNAFEINVRAPLILTQQFLRNCSQDAVLIAVSSFIVHIPGSAVATAPASYASSKIATAKLVEYVASENPDIRAYSVHPGIIDTTMSQKSREMAEEPVEITWDNVNVASDFMVWLSSKEGKEVVPSGRFLWANWDVDELKARKDEFWNDPAVLTVALEARMGAPEKIE